MAGRAVAKANTPKGMVTKFWMIFLILLMDIRLSIQR
jgi:hypothetical protein